MSVDFVGRLGGRYDLGPLLGTGGMAMVYRATDAVLEREVAVKVLRSSAGAAERERFLDEGRILAQLSHPGLVTLLDFGVDEEQPFLVMELVEGTTLAALLGSPMDPGQVRRIGAELADALAFAHSAGVIHRDVKPGNILIRENGRVALFDFGIAKLTSNLRQHTAPGESVGTAAYLAPEQVQGQDVTTATDVYSLGLVLLELLKGEREYTGPAVEAAVARLRRPPEVPPSLDVEWQRLLRQMTAEEPGFRPSARDVAAALWGQGPAAAADSLATMAGLPTLPPPVPLLGRITGRRVLLTLGIVAILIVLMSGIVLAKRESTPPPPQTSPPAAQEVSSVPTVAPGLQFLLEDLHATLEPMADRTAITALLGRVDRALVDRRYAAARDHLLALRDRLRSLGATTAVMSTQALLAALPDTAAQPKATAEPKPRTHDAGPSDKAGKGKGHNNGKGKGSKKK